MSRADGFDVADTDTGLMSDPKVLALARRLRDSTQTGAALALYEAVVLASWKAGRRIALADALPGWWLDPVDGLVGHLVGVGLLDADQCIPEHAWEGWYGPARDRREYYRALGSKGGLAKAALAHATPSATPHALPRPSVPTDRSVSARVRARGERGLSTEEERPGTLRETLAAMGLDPR